MNVEHPESHCGRCGGPNVTWVAPSPPPGQSALTAPMLDVARQAQDDVPDAHPVASSSVAMSYRPGTSAPSPQRMALPRCVAVCRATSPR